MSQENVEIVKRWTHVIEDGGHAGYAEMIDAVFSPDATWVEDPRWPGAATFRGAEAIKQHIREYNEGFGWAFKIERITAVGADVVVLVEVSGRGGVSGAETRTHFAFRLTFEGGKIVRWRVYLDPADALEAVGLSE